MKVARVLMVGLAVMSLSTAANGAYSVWWEATAGPGVPGGGSLGGPGEVLKLNCDTSAGPVTCSWTVKMFLEVGQNDTPIIGWGHDLLGSPTDDGKVAVTNAFYKGPFTTFSNPFGNPANFEAAFGGAPDLIINTFAAGGAAGVGPGVHNILEFTLEKTKNQGDLNSAIITSAVNFGAWADILGGVPNINFAGTNLDANVGTATGTVIQINNIPEPGTIALLGLGAIALIRRRR